MATAVAAALLLWFVLEVPSAPFHNDRLVAAVIAVTFACAAWLLRAVSASGALAGAIVAFLFYMEAGSRYFAVLLLVFLLTWAATLTGRRKKAVLETMREPSRRTAAQVMANLGIATTAVLWAGSHGLVFYAISVAALSEAAADTVSSEVGKAFGRRTVLITNFSDCPAGTDGGVSWVGTAAGILAALVTSAAALWKQVDMERVWIVMAAATLGMFADSLAGALWERSGEIGNDLVNLMGTATAAVLAWAMLQVL